MSLNVYEIGECSGGNDGNSICVGNEGRGTVLKAAQYQVAQITHRIEIKHSSTMQEKQDRPWQHP